ncbi:AhpC/TSA family protein [Reichenbachiella agarivorans]|uniref:thioredoxin-dependent peroxiredoxin n=1 Tax=Reichenbachiella agarivorans TaxID=2979464 RepID=A0ABY6CSG5_9BACT|nr:peroxiredoxin-like family protein [Reichenbachiella agarivorans]UXP33461.1 AhpC/TSA family protein [Reichenbachiella agarivorans]
MNKLLKIISVCCLIIACSTALSYGQSANSKYKVGDTAPNFSGTDQFGQSFDLSTQLKEGPVVLMFYRGYWCPYCNKQLSQMQDSLQFITAKGGSVIAVTPEQPEYIEKTLDKTKASFKVVHDADLSIMTSYGVAFEMEEQLVTKYKKNGLDLDAINGDNGSNLPVPATYIINTDGKILYVFYDPDYSKRATVKKILQNL